MRTLSAGENVTVENEAAVRRWLPRFSLLTLVLLTLLAGLSVLLYTARREHVKALAVAEAYRAENRELRDRFGIFDVTDASKTHVRAIREPAANTWSWNVYLPTERKYWLHLSHADIGFAGLPEKGQTHGWLDGGHFRVTATYQQGDDSKTRIVIMRDDQKSLQLDFSADKWMASSTHCAGQSRTELTDPAEPLVLLRLKSGEKSGPQSWSSTTKPTPGILLWVSERKDGE